MIGLSRARRAIDDKVTRPVSAAVILSVFAVLMAAIAILMAGGR